ncbi:Rad17-domain-containing protein [Panus rudis PR-1116 ss-1]|nr:Rad17-domain-containing protein [Panus rudis PR-1116 ss-1]
MAPKSRSQKPLASRASTLKIERVSGEEPSTKKRKMMPLLSLSTSAPIFDLSDFSSPEPETGQPRDVKGKGKTNQNERTAFNDAASQSAPQEVISQLWTTLYEPKSEEDLAVHKKKVQDVRQWFLEAFEGGPSGKLRKYRRILVLTGPAGSGKTATVRVLSEELGFEVLEWRNGVDEKHSRDTFEESSTSEDYESLSQRFRSFMTRAVSCRPILSAGTSLQPSSSSSQVRRRVVLLEDLPNVLHPSTQQMFHAALESFVDDSSLASTPIVIIISDSGLRGEIDQDEMGASSSWRSKSRDVIDIRTVLPSSLQFSPYVTHVEFNPIATTLMRRALQSIINSHFSSGAKSKSCALGAAPSKDVLDLVIDSSQGDIRSAIMSLQFAIVSHALNSAPVGGKGKKKKGNNASSRALMELVTRREQSLALFHLLGKLLYNKRKGDPPASSASAKDVHRDKELDAKLKDPPKLPPHLSSHDRPPSRVNIESLYADSPIESGLLSLYVHQNYTQFCNEVDECDSLMDNLSWIDSNLGETWQQSNPHRFHLISLGTLHSLPHPVTRRNQKNYKPEFFDVQNRIKQCEDGVRDVHEWLRKDEHGSLGGWTRRNVALEVGAVLKARQQRASQTNTSPGIPMPPPSHSLFSYLPFSKESSGRLEVANENDIPEEVDVVAPGEDTFGTRDADEEKPSASTDHGWLEDDDIEDM